MIKLTVTTPKVTKTEDIDPSILGKLEILAHEQSNNGFGKPSTSYFSNLVGNYNKRQQLKELADSELYTFIEKPKFIALGTYSWENTIVAFSPPKIAMTRLGTSVIGITLWPFRSYSSSVPFIPSSIQEYIKRFKEKAPAADLYIIFEPRWKKVPSGDPVIVAELEGQWIKLAEWDGDQDLINSLLREIK